MALTRVKPVYGVTIAKACTSNEAVALLTQVKAHIAMETPNNLGLYL